MSEAAGKHPHADSGCRCCVAHSDNVQCIRCARCHQYVRPEDMDDGCPVEDE